MGRKEPGLPAFIDAPRGRKPRARRPPAPRWRRAVVDGVRMGNRMLQALPLPIGKQAVLQCKSAAARRT
jgi:hypothetical protein